MTKKFTRELSGKLYGYSLIAEEDAVHGTRFQINIPERARTFDEGIYMDSDTLESFAQVGKQLIEDLKEAKKAQECIFKQSRPFSAAFVLDVEYGVDEDGDVRIERPSGSVSYVSVEMLLALCDNSFKVSRILGKMIEESDEYILDDSADSDDE